MYCNVIILQIIFYFFNRILPRKRLAGTVLIFTESSDQLSRVTDRVPGLPSSPVQNKSFPGDKNGDNYADGD